MEKLTEKEIKIYARAHEFLSMKEPGDLAACLGLPLGLILEAIDGSDTDYYTFGIPKKKGGFRKIEAPGGILKGIQKRVSFLLNVIYYRMRPACVHGFVKNIHDGGESFSIVSNAGAHTGARYVLNMDLRNFFHSIDIRRVKTLFMSYPFFLSNDMAAYMALLTAYKDRLPMGAPTSPVISNLACFLFDRRMMRFAEEQGLAFTRYADDLTFSSNHKITDSTILAIKGIIQDYRFGLNEEKTRLFTSGGRQMVTGLKVNEKVNVDRKFIRSIRAMLHNWRKQGISGASAINAGADEFYNIVKGKIDFLKMVRGEHDPVYQKLRTDFKALRAALKQEAWE